MHQRSPRDGRGRPRSVRGLPPSTGSRRGHHRGRAHRSLGLTDSPAPRQRAERLPPDTRRALIIDAAEALLVEQDPLLLTFDEVARAAGVSRPLVHTYLGDRRGLLDAVQVRIIGRLDGWVDARVTEASTATARLRELIGGLMSFVEIESDAWGVLLASGGLDHPALHQVRGRWVDALVGDVEARRLGAQAAVAALIAEAGGWATRGADPVDLEIVLGALLLAPESSTDDHRADRH